MSNHQLPTIRAMVEKYNLAAKKSLGQNFLFDLNITNKIAKAAGDLQNLHVLEIGPGPGGLTRALLDNGANVTAIEYDKRCIVALKEVQAHYPGRLNVIEADALQFDFVKFAHSQSTPIDKIVGNLPYNIGTQLLLNWLLVDVWPPFYQDLTLMFQKEVADRIIAAANSPAYGRLSILANWRCHTEIAFELPPSVFSPPPKVNSAIVRLIPKPTPLACDLAKLDKITKFAFTQRRKMLRQSLKAIGGEALLQRADIDPTKRAENLSIEEYVKLANLI